MAFPTDFHGFSHFSMAFPRFSHPRCSMYGIFNYIYPKNGPNVGKYSIHGASGHGFSHGFSPAFPPSNLASLPLGDHEAALGHQSGSGHGCQSVHRMEKMVIFGGILPMENWVKIGKFGEFYHGKLEKNGKFWWDFTMENWKKMGNFGGILPWKIGKKWEILVGF